MVLLVIIILLTSITVLHRTEAKEEMIYQEVLVVPGDTLWAIARKIAPNQDPRKTIWEIREENQLKQAVVYPGQTLRVRVYGST